MPAAVWQGEDVLLILHVQPGARQSGFAGLHGEALKIRIQAPPLEGRANKALCHFMAEAFAVTLGQVELLSGEGARHKRLLVRAPRRIPPEVAALLAATS